MDRRISYSKIRRTIQLFSSFVYVRITIDDCCKHIVKYVYMERERDDSKLLMIFLDTMIFKNVE